MTRLRRRLLVASAPVAMVALLLAAKLVSMVLAGNAAVQSFSRADAAALSDDVATLQIFDVIETGGTEHAAGALAVLQDRLDDAEAQFAQALSRTAPDRSCALRIDLALVRETRGDRAAYQTPDAVDFYRAARSTVEQAPAGCFAGNDDRDPARQAVREDALARLDAKIAAVSTLPPPPPPPPVAPPVAAVPAPAPGAAPTETEIERRLEPGQGNPLDKLGEILRDAS